MPEVPPRMQRRSRSSESAMNDFALRISNVSKCYQIYDTPRDRLKQFVLPRIQRAAGMAPRRYFSEFWALKDVNFVVGKGETVGIVGRNGSGKSTLLQIICGTLNPTSGNVEVQGRIAALLELGSGFNPEFTGRENVYMNAAVLGLSREEVDSRFDDIAAFADIGRFIEQPVKTYSSGMAVRLAFAVQAVIDPDVFIVDEALAVGDEKFQRKCFARLEQLKSRGCSILFVSHSPASVIEFCDHALLIDQGKRLMFDRPSKTIRAYQKMLYAPADRQKLLADEYRREDMGLLGSDMAQEATSNPGQPSGYFDPGLVPDTTTSYPVQGAEIQSIQIRDADGAKVNALRPGERYEFVVSGRLLTDFEGLFFGIHIRSVSGMVITGQRYPEEGKYIHHAQAGQNFRICFGFKMDVLPGVYFVGSGVWSSREPNCAHRILDAIMFRVIPAKSPISFGYVDISSKNPNAEFY